MPGEQNFPRACRLLKPAEFQQVFAQNQRSSDAGMTLLMSEVEGTQARLGLAIAKKQIRLAVQRNRIKRLIRESFRHHRQHLPQRDFVVLVRQPILQMDNTAVRNALHKHWQRLSRKCAK